MLNTLPEVTQLEHILELIPQSLYLGPVLFDLRAL